MRVPACEILYARGLPRPAVDAYLAVGREDPVADLALPVADANILDLDDDDADFLALDEATSPGLSTARLRALEQRLAKASALGRIERVVFEVLLAVVVLLVGASRQQRGRTAQRGRDARQLRRVEVL